MSQHYESEWLAQVRQHWAKADATKSSKGRKKAWDEALVAPSEKELEELSVTPKQIAELVSLVEGKKINDKIGRQVLSKVLDGEGDPAAIVEKENLAVVSDDSVLEGAVDQAIADNPDVVEKIKGGKVQAIGALIGPVMKATRGQADAGRVREIIMDKLEVG